MSVRTVGSSVAGNLSATLPINRSVCCNVCSVAVISVSVFKTCLSGINLSVGKSIKRFEQPQTITNKIGNYFDFLFVYSRDSITFAL